MPIGCENNFIFMNDSDNNGRCGSALHEQYHPLTKTKVIVKPLTTWLIRCFITVRSKGSLECLF